MKKIVLLSALALAGCATQPSPQQLNDRVREIQSYARTLCSFVPTINTVATLVGQSGISSTIAIAQDICTAVTTQPLSEGPTRRPPTVRGVMIKGSFVRRR